MRKNSIQIEIWTIQITINLVIIAISIPEGQNTIERQEIDAKV
jgi:hypothetical protein